MRRLRVDWGRLGCGGRAFSAFSSSMVDGGGGSCSSRGDLVEEVLGREGGDLSMSILWMVSGEVGLLPGIRGDFFSWGFELLFSIFTDLSRGY